MINGSGKHLLVSSLFTRFEEETLLGKSRSLGVGWHEGTIDQRYAEEEVGCYAFLLRLWNGGATLLPCSTLIMILHQEEEEYDRVGDEEEFESDYSEGHISQLRFLLGKKRKNNFEEVVNASIEPPPPLPQNYEARDFRHLTQSDGKGHLFTLVATTSVSGEPMEFDESSTDYGNAIRVFPDMMPTEYENGCISFAHLRTYLDHTKVNIRDPANAKNFFKAFMLLYFGGALFGNSKSWARLELLCPIAILENKAYTMDFGSAILGHLYYCLDQASKQEVKYIGGLFQLIEYHCYEYCQKGHHILIDNRNMKEALKREVIIVGNINRKKVLLQCPFGGYEWYLGDHCWAQLEYCAVSYDPPEKLHCFPSFDVVRSLRAAGWIEAQHYIVGHHIDYDAYWRHVSHGALMSNIARGLKSNGKMKRELLKRGLHVGGVRWDGHLMVGPLLPNDQDDPGDLLFSVVWVLAGIICLVLCSVV
ncbi:hypothetical protein GIB67_009230 [Kingdonia uniflora]|uniref:Uncharacterized protein n=1 Tax=Kingdonia uniflora TaxID=39325 RepID=A0A7J7N2I3_9MAGN|nr:hypothetical protein GIB67_009230 [Kingdonia uniflora]